MESLNLKKCFMDVSLELEEECLQGKEIELKERFFQYIIKLALGQLHGETGEGIPFDIIQYREEELRAILRLPSSDLVHFWSALTLFSNFDNTKCVFRVHKVTLLLSELDNNSHTYIHSEYQDNESTRKKRKLDNMDSS